MKNKKILWLGFGLLLISILIIGKISSPGLFKANLLEQPAPADASTYELYLADYTARSGDSDNIVIRTGTGFTNMMALSFTLKYNPNQINFLSEINLGSGFTVKPEMFTITPDNTLGTAVIDIASSNTFSMTANSNLLEIPIKVLEGITENTKLAISFSDTQIIDQYYGIKSAKTRNGEITILPPPTESLKVLNTDLISDYQIGVNFDDYLRESNLSTIGMNIAYYNNPNLNLNFLDASKNIIDAADGKRLVYSIRSKLANDGINIQTNETKINYDGQNFSLKQITNIQDELALRANTKLGFNNTMAKIAAKNVVVYNESNFNRNLTLTNDTNINIVSSAPQVITLPINTAVSFIDTLAVDTNIKLPNNTLLELSGNLSFDTVTMAETILPVAVSSSTTITPTETILPADTKLKVKATISEATLGQIVLTKPVVITPTTTEITLPVGTIYQTAVGNTQTITVETKANVKIDYIKTAAITANVKVKGTVLSILTAKLVANTELTLVNAPTGVILAEDSQPIFRTDRTFKLTFLNTTDINTPHGNAKSPLNTDRMDANHLISYVASKSAMGTNDVISVNAIDTSKIVVQFKSVPDANIAANPIKYILYDSSGNNKIIKSVELSGLTATLKLQNALTNGAKYFFIAQDIPQMSQNKIKHFWLTLAGETKILSITPESITADGGEVTLTGQNLNEITGVKMDNTSLAIVSQTTETLVLTIPAKLTPKLYDLQFNTKSGQIIIKQNFLLIADKASILSINLDSSYASPRKVAPGSETILWAIIEDPRGTGEVEKVTLDLRPIDGSAIAPMIGIDKDGQPLIVNNKRSFYLKTMVPKTVGTSEIPKEIPITAEDPRGNKATGMITLIVTKNILTSEKPEIIKVDAVPTKIKTGEKLGVYAYIKDLDGISDIDKVVADFSPIGLGPKTLVSADAIISESDSSAVPNSSTPAIPPAKPASATVNNDENMPIERTTQWYGLNDLPIPVSTKAGTYDIKITVSDKSGETGLANLSLNVTNGNMPIIDEERTELTPRSSLPNDGKETFSLTTFVSDEDGVGDITSVIVDLSDIGGSCTNQGADSSKKCATTIPMELQGEIKEGQKGGYFMVSDLTVAVETGIGTRELIVYAYDAQGNEAKLTVEIEVTAEDEVGKAPQIESTRSYTTPAEIENDEESTVVLNVFIEKHDFEITQVTVNLENIAKYIGQPVTTSADAATNCLNQTDRIICMIPGIKEGTRGQWYTLSNVVVLKNTPHSMEPYRLVVTVTDSKGKTGDGYVFLNVGDGTLPTPQTGYPKVQMTISTSPENVEVLFSNPVDPKKVTIGAFKVTNSNDVTDMLAVTGVVMNADATVATLTTDTQEPEKFYTLFADAKMIGLKEAQYTDNHADFVGFDLLDIPPQLTKVTPKSATLLEVIFSEGLRPSSVSSYANDFQIFTREQQPQRLAVEHVEFQDDNQTLRVSTAPQISGMTYTLRVNNILSAAGVKVGGNEKPRQTAKKEYYGIHKNFTGFKGTSKDKQSIMESGDFDGNGKIDFTDFTIFSSVYGLNLANGGVGDTASVNPPDSQPTPIAPTPNAAVPVTSPVNPFANTPTPSPSSPSTQPTPATKPTNPVNPFANTPTPSTPTPSTPTPSTPTPSTPTPSTPTPTTPKPTNPFTNNPFSK